MKFLVSKKIIREEIYTIEAKDNYAVLEILELEDISNIGTFVSSDDNIKLDWWEEDEIINN